MVLIRECEIFRRIIPPSKNMIFFTPLVSIEINFNPFTSICHYVEIAGLIFDIWCHFQNCWLCRCGQCICSGKRNARGEQPTFGWENDYRPSSVRLRSNATATCGV